MAGTLAETDQGAVLADPFDHAAEAAEAYFKDLSAQFSEAPGVKAVCVAHMVPNSVHFLPALNSLVQVQLVLAKPRSQNATVKQHIASKFHLEDISRLWAVDPKRVVSTFYRCGLKKARVVIVDIGGYFSEALAQVIATFEGRILGVLEGTENGLKRYRGIERELTVPVFTVAESPLKYPENYLIGVSIVFSIEAVLRSRSSVLQSFRACVIGFGNVGRSAASELRARGVSTVVYDKAALPLAEASARGYPVYRDLADALADSTLVVCATGNKALDVDGFRALKDGAYVATVTSGDDELDLDALTDGYTRRQVSEVVDRYSDSRREFFLINSGNAVNFLHDAVVGPAIQLIEGEKLAAVAAICKHTGSGGIYTVDPDSRTAVANTWLDHFVTT